jgi:hypothetical protein
MCDTYTWQGQVYTQALNKDYNRKGSLEKISGRDPQGDWRQEELFGGKLPVVKTLKVT